MNLTLNLNYLIRQLKFVFLFIIWAYCTLRILYNTLSTTWVSLTEGFYHPHGLTQWWYYIQMMPAWWAMHLVVIFYIPLLLNNDFQLILQKRTYKLLNYSFWFVFAPMLIVIF